MPGLTVRLPPDTLTLALLTVTLPVVCRVPVLMLLNVLTPVLATSPDRLPIKFEVAVAFVKVPAAGTLAPISVPSILPLLMST